MGTSDDSEHIVNFMNLCSKSFGYPYFYILRMYAASRASNPRYWNIGGGNQNKLSEVPIDAHFCKAFQTGFAVAPLLGISTGQCFCDYLTL